MEDNFHPTRKDLLSIESLILDIKSKKRKAVERKMNLEKQISNTDNKVQKYNLKNILHTIELNIKELNDELSFKNKLKLEIEEYLRTNSQSESEEVNKIIQKLLALKKQYSEFTKDKTRIASLRIMSAEFVDELDKIIKGK